MYMKKYQVLKDFKGSPTGVVSIAFQKDLIVGHDELGDDLVGVAIKEKWIEVIKSDDPENITQEQIINAIAEIDQNDESLWTSENKPTVEAISEIVGSYVTAAQRDEAFALFIQT